MTDREMQKKIAELLGWKPMYNSYDDHLGSFTEGFPPGSKLLDGWVKYPDWFHDLTACVRDFKLPYGRVISALERHVADVQQDTMIDSAKWVRIVTVEEFAKILCAAFITARV